MNRRQVLGSAMSFFATSITPAFTRADRRMVTELPKSALIDIDTYVWRMMDERHIPGVAACLFDRTHVIWSESYGWADIENRIPMATTCVQNVASISKTFTATAIMQLVEMGLVELDKGVNDYCDFPVRNPRAPDQEITVRQLLVHTSSIADGEAYSLFYACGDPRIALKTWLGEYFTPGGRYFNAEQNFHSWTPRDERFEYCNLAYGLLAYIVETVSNRPFPDYCRGSIFAPLHMSSTSWRIEDILPSQHLVPYSYVENGHVRGPNWGGSPLGAIQQDGPTLDKRLDDGYSPNCIYGHANYPDGFLRTSVSDLSNYARAYLNDGAFGGRRILKQSTVREMLQSKIDFSKQPPEVRKRQDQGLTWYADSSIGTDRLWGHGGSDPGVNTDFRIMNKHNLGAIVFTNTNGVAPWDITRQVLGTAVKYIK